MGYHLHGFGGESPPTSQGVLLPTGQSVDGLGAEVPSDVAATAGGSHFAYGSGIVPLGVHRINHRGIYFADVETSVNAFFGLLGQRKKLWRKQEDDGAYHWKHARLLRCQWDRDVSQSQHAEVISEFEAAGYWKSATATDSTATGTGPYILEPVGGGNAPVYGALLTFTPTGSTALTSVRMKDTESSIDWTWTGGGSSSLTIDCGEFSVQNNGLDSYVGFTLEDGTSDGGEAAPHASDYWCAILPGEDNEFTVTTDGVGAAIEIEWYDSWV